MSAVKQKALSAKDVMQRDVIVAYEGDSLQEAMQIMTENHVTGLPVVNSKSKCVGVITASDILNYEQEHADFTAEANDNLARHYNPETEKWESVRITSFALEEFGEVRVGEVMARDLVYVDRDAPLHEVARKMRDERIHRVLVLSDDLGIQGIVSSFDFVKLYAEAD
jgi:CBS domain-containing protein